MIQCQSHRRKRRGADGDAVLNALGIIHRPLQRLHAADGRADHDSQMLHAEIVEHMRLRAHNVANCHHRKIRPIRLAGCRIDGGWPGRSVTGAENVGADDAIARQIEYAAKHLGPPVGSARRSRESVTDQHCVVAAFVQLAIDGVADGDRLQRAAGLQAKRRILRQYYVPFPSWLQGRTHRQSPATCAADCSLPFSEAGSLPVATRNPRSRSAIMSRMSSMPTDRRTSSGVVPVSRCSDSLSCWWVVDAG